MTCDHLWNRHLEEVNNNLTKDISLFTVYFYNFGMPDYGVSSLVGIIDGVKVLDFAVKEGRVAIHCHAGLGRTGEMKQSCRNIISKR